jgi:hypothetical protein
VIQVVETSRSVLGTGTPARATTAGDKTIDGDMILAAQAMTLNVLDVVIATTNVGHLSRFVRADLWQNITPNQ